MQDQSSARLLKMQSEQSGSAGGKLCLLFVVILFTVYCLLFTVHCSPFTVHCSYNLIYSHLPRFRSLFKLKGGLSSYRHRASEQELRDEYGNVFSGAHVLARLTEAGKMLGSKSWVRSVCSMFHRCTNNGVLC
jgi:hypothetical protein